ncbi:MAG: hypothetical protein LUC41_05335, partial [Clostridiales bacterium]|nr:hypothetical protein [Clostridiales bacterium]
SADALEPAEWTDVDLLTSGEKHYSVFGKISTMFKNIRFLYRMLGSTDIASIGDGTVTGALDKLNRVMEDEGGDTAADTAEDTVTFTSADALEPAEWTDVDVLASGEKHSSIFNKISVMFKNIRYLYKVLGTEDISSLGDGTITGALNALNTGKDDSGDDEDSGDGYLKMYTLESTSSDLDSDLQALFDTFPTGCFAICATANTYCYGYFGYKVDLYGGSGVIIRMNFSSSTETIQYTRILSGMWWPTWTDL